MQAEQYAHEVIRKRFEIRTLKQLKELFLEAQENAKQVFKNRLKSKEFGTEYNDDVLKSLTLKFHKLSTASFERAVNSNCTTLKTLRNEKRQRQVSTQGSGASSASGDGSNDKHVGVADSMAVVIAALTQEMKSVFEKIAQWAESQES